MAQTTKKDCAVCPFTVLIDTREQLNFEFTGLRTDANQGRLPLRVPTIRGTLPSGDYSIAGIGPDEKPWSSSIAIERKSLIDLFGTLSRGRARFIRELERLDALDFAAVVVEADWPTILREPPERSRLNPLTVFRSVIAWQQRYPRVHWWLAPSRVFAERATYRMLERWWKDNVKQNVKAKAKRHRAEAVKGNRS